MISINVVRWLLLYTLLRQKHIFVNSSDENLKGSNDPEQISQRGQSEGDSGDQSENDNNLDTADKKDSIVDSVNVEAIGQLDNILKEYEGDDSEPPEPERYELEIEDYDEDDKPIDLDIGIKEDTEQFRCIIHPEIKTRIYIPKDGYLFKLVKKTVPRLDFLGKIWTTADPFKFANKVVLRSDFRFGVKKLIIRHADGDKKYFKSYGQGILWTEKEMIVKPTLLDKSKHPSLEIYTIDDQDESKTNKNDHAKYSVHRFGDIFKYIFTDEAKCVKILAGGVKHLEIDTEQGETQYPKEMYLSERTKQITVYIFRTTFLYGYDHEWVEDENDDKKLANSDFKILTTYSNHPHETSVNDNTHYDEDKCNSWVKCTLKQGVNLVKLKYENRTIWKHGNETEGVFPKSVFFHPGMKLFFLEFSNSLDFYRYSEGKWILESTINSSEFSESEITMTLEDDENKENDTEKYEDDSIGPIKGFKMGKHFRHITVKYENSVLYEIEQEQDVKCPVLSIYVFGDPKYVIIWDKDKSYYVNFE